MEPRTSCAKWTLCVYEATLLKNIHLHLFLAKGRNPACHPHTCTHCVFLKAKFVSAYGEISNFF